MIQEYSVESKSRKELRRIAEDFRRQLKLEDRIDFPIVELLDVLSIIFGDFSYEIVEDVELPDSVHADTDIVSGHIRIKQSVYDSAYIGNGRDRMTVAHEIGHFLLLHKLGFEIQRNFGRELPAYEDPEWQAKCFAGELMISKKLTEGMEPFEIADACKVSLEAATCQYKAFGSEDHELIRL